MDIEDLQITSGHKQKPELTEEQILFSNHRISLLLIKDINNNFNHFLFLKRHLKIIWGSL